MPARCTFDSFVPGLSVPAGFHPFKDINKLSDPLPCWATVTRIPSDVNAGIIGVPNQSRTAVVPSTSLRLGQIVGAFLLGLYALAWRLLHIITRIIRCICRYSQGEEVSVRTWQRLHDEHILNPFCSKTYHILSSSTCTVPSSSPSDTLHKHITPAGSCPSRIFAFTVFGGWYAIKRK